MIVGEVQLASCDRPPAKFEFHTPPPSEDPQNPTVRAWKGLQLPEMFNARHFLSTTITTFLLPLTWQEGHTGIDRRVCTVGWHARFGVESAHRPPISVPVP